MTPTRPIPSAIYEAAIYDRQLRDDDAQAEAARILEERTRHAARAASTHVSHALDLDLDPAGWTRIDVLRHAGGPDRPVVAYPFDDGRHLAYRHAGPAEGGARLTLAVEEAGTWVASSILIVDLAALADAADDLEEVLAMYGPQAAGEAPLDGPDLADDPDPSPSVTVSGDTYAQIAAYALAALAEGRT